MSSLRCVWATLHRHTSLYLPLPRRCTRELSAVQSARIVDNLTFVSRTAQESPARLGTRSASCEYARTLHTETHPFDLKVRVVSIVRWLLLQSVGVLREGAKTVSAQAILVSTGSGLTQRDTVASSRLILSVNHKRSKARCDRWLSQFCSSEFSAVLRDLVSGELHCSQFQPFPILLSFATIPSVSANHAFDTALSSSVEAFQTLKGCSLS